MAKNIMSILREVQKLLYTLLDENYSKVDYPEKLLFEFDKEIALIEELHLGTSLSERIQYQLQLKLMDKKSNPNYIVPL
jgi:hypothetical protein